jgi:hypothetical protein
MSAGLRRNRGSAQVAVLEQAFRRPKLFIRRVFFSVKFDVGVIFTR